MLTTFQWQHLCIFEGSLNSKLPTIWRVEKQMWQAVKSEVKRCTSAKVRRKKIHPRQMLEKSRNAVFFQWFVCRASRKVGLLKRRVRSHVVRGESENCTPLWRKAHLEVNMLKKLTVSAHFLKFRCAKLARRCGEKRIWKWKCSKHLMAGGLFAVQMSKKLHDVVAKTTFWSKQLQNTSVSEHFLKFWCPKIARGSIRTLGSENVQSTSVSKHFLLFGCRKIARRCGEKHIIKSKCTKHVSSGQFFEVLMSKN